VFSPEVSLFSFVDPSVKSISNHFLGIDLIERMIKGKEAYLQVKTLQMQLQLTLKFIVSKVFMLQICVCASARDFSKLKHNIKQAHRSMKKISNGEG
jgi:hypothetical protein